MPIKQSNQEIYNTWSSFYDEYSNSTVAIDELNFPTKYSEFKNMSILEIGCGTGRHTKRLINQNNRVVGVDVSEGMIAQARSKIDHPNLELLHGDFLRLSFQDKLFDGIIMSLVLEHISNLDLFFEKARRVLKENGLFYFSEIHPKKAQSGHLAHFKDDKENEFVLNSTAHNSHDIQNAFSPFFELISNETIVGSVELAQLNEKWKKHLDKPLIEIWKLKVK